MTNQVVQQVDLDHSDPVLDRVAEQVNGRVNILVHQLMMMISVYRPVFFHVRRGIQANVSFTVLRIWY